MEEVCILKIILGLRFFNEFSSRAGKFLMSINIFDYLIDNFHEMDIHRVLSEDYYVHRWFMHVFDMPGDQIETCTNNMIKALKWRKDENIRGNISTYTQGR